jgi:hypothetical protein
VVRQALPSRDDEVCGRFLAAAAVFAHCASSFDKK